MVALTGINSSRPGCTVRDLEVALLYHELSCFVEEAYECLLTSGHGSYEEALLDLGNEQQPFVYSSAFKQLQVAKSFQHLQPLGGGAVTEGDLNDFCGCPDSLLGVSPEALKLSHLPELPARQLVPEVEARLAQRHTSLAALCECYDEAMMVEEVAAQVQGADAAAEKAAAAWARCVQEAHTCIVALNQLVAGQAAALRHHKLEHQQVADDEDEELLVAWCHQMVAKIQLVEQRLLQYTYQPQTMPALSAVDRHLAEAEEQAAQTLGQLTARLQQFDVLGPEFKAFAERYQELLEELRHAEFTLQEFKFSTTATP